MILDKPLLFSDIMKVPHSYSHLNISAVDYLQQFCQPLFNLTEVTFFKFDRYYKNGYGFSYNSYSAEFNFHYLQDDLYPSWSELMSYYQYSKYAYVDREFYKHQALEDDIKWVKNIELSKKHNMNERFYVLDKVDTYFDVLGFSCDLENSKPLQYYIENLHIIEKFILYFRSQASHFIHEATRNKVKFHETFLAKSNQVNATNLTDEYFNIKSTNLPITLSEQKCLGLLAKGNTMKQVASYLDISPRTVEVHMRNMKSKLGLQYKNQLIEYWHNAQSILVT